MRKKANIVYLLICLSISVCACGPSQADLDATATQVVEDHFATLTAAPTATATATPIPTSTPTPIPGKFLNPPEYLESVFYSDWMWLTNAQGLRLAMDFNLDGDFSPMLAYEGDRAVNVACLFKKAGEAQAESQAFIEYLPTILDNFVSSGTQEQIYQFMSENIDLGKYDATIDSFAVVYEVKLYQGVTSLTLTIWEM